MSARSRLASRDWGSAPKRQDGTAPPDACCSKCSGPMQMNAPQRKKRPDLPERLQFMMLLSPPSSDGRGSVRANHPAPATAEIAAWRDEARTTIEAVATTTIETATTTAPATTATAAPATPAASTALCMRGGAAGRQHDGGGTDQTDAVNRDKRRGCKAAGQ